ncbi:MAG: hypothetical protein GY788_07510 [bacterium]|nr:hypothetical protein [bacterium]
MFDLTPIVASIQANAPGIQQVIRPDAVDSSQVATAPLLVTLLDPVIGSRLYPLILPDDDAQVYPAAVYQLAASERAAVDGYPILRDDGYVIGVLAQTYAALATQTDAFRDALLAYDPADAAGAISIGTQADAYHEDHGLFESGLDVRVTHLSRASQALPAAFVYPVGIDPQLEVDYSGAEGEVVETFVVLLVAKVPANGVSAMGALRDELLNAVVGYRAAGAVCGTVNWLDGEVYSIHNGMVIWRDLFSTTYSAAYPAFT